MKSNRALVCVLGVFLSLVSLACSPSGRWGNRAFYSPAHRGYVISAEAPDDRPERFAQTIVLTDPLDGAKVTCREEAVAVLGAHSRVGAEDVERENILVGTGIALFPLTAVGAAGLYVAAGGLAYSVVPAFLAVPDAGTRYHEGLAMFRKGRWGAARQKLELALTGDTGIGQRTTALFELGRAYEKLEEPEMATRSYLSFVRRSLVPAEAEYMRAEAFLEEQGLEMPECQSQKEIEVIWPD